MSKSLNLTFKVVNRSLWARVSNPKLVRIETKGRSHLHFANVLSPHVAVIVETHVGFAAALLEGRLGDANVLDHGGIGDYHRLFTPKDPAEIRELRVQVIMKELMHINHRCCLSNEPHATTET